MFQTPTLIQGCIFFCLTPPGGGGEYGQTTSFGKKIIEREFKKGYLFPNW